MRRLILWFAVLSLGMFAASACTAQDANPRVVDLLDQIDKLAGRISLLSPLYHHEHKVDGPVPKVAAPNSLREAVEKRVRLIRELYLAAPRHSRVKSLLLERWELLRGLTWADAIREIDDAVEKSGDPTIKADGAEAVIKNFLDSDTATQGDLKLAFDTFEASVARDDYRLGNLLLALATWAKDPAYQAECQERCIAEFPEYAESARILKRRRTEIGKPFALEFADPIGGKPVRMTDLRGKVVVLVFWATRNREFRAEQPAMKRLSEQYRDRGVVFIGAPLETSQQRLGREKVRNFVAEEQIPWPQYFLTEEEGRNLATSWGNHSFFQFPDVFVIDRDGNLASTEA